MYDRTKSPHQKVFVGYNAQKITGRPTVTEGEAFFKLWLSDSHKELVKGNQIIAFYKYQLDALIAKYSTNLKVYHNKEFSWWECKLSNIEKYRRSMPIKKYLDFDINKIIMLRKQGFSYAKIAKQFGCSEYAIKTRVKKVLNEEEK